MNNFIQTVISNTALMTFLGTVLTVGVGNWLLRKGQKDSRRQAEMANRLNEREQRWEQMTETIVHQRTLIEELKAEVVGLKSRVLAHIKYEKKIKDLAHQHKRWDAVALKNNPELGEAPELCPDPEDDPYFK